MASKSKYLPTGRCFTAEYARETVAWFINKQRGSIARDNSLISRKEKAMNNDKLCTCGTCEVCKAVLIDLEMVPQHIDKQCHSTPCDNDCKACCGGTLPLPAKHLPIADDMEGICVSCGADLEEMSSSLGAQMDYSGMASMTEDEQCYMEGNGKGRCPDCINGGELLPATYAQGISEAGMADVMLDNEDDPDLDMLPTRLPLTDEEAHHLD